MNAVMTKATVQATSAEMHITHRLMKRQQMGSRKNKSTRQCTMYNVFHK